MLQGFSLGPCAAQEIANILAVNPNIAHLDLRKNNLGDLGVKHLMHVVKSNNSLVHLDLAQNKISTKGAKKVFKALAVNKSLISLRVGNIENDSKNQVGLKAVPSLNHFVQSSQILTFLDLKSTNLTDAGLAMLCQGLIGNQSIFNLNLSKNDITQAGMEHFAPILTKTKLEELDLSLNPLGNSGVRTLAENFITQHIDARTGLPTRGIVKCSLLKLNLAETKMEA